MFYVFADESGDHWLSKIDLNYPVFVLAFCVFRKDTYEARVRVPLRDFKQRHCGTTNIVLHESDIRRQRNGFEFLADSVRRGAFMADLTNYIEAAPFDLIAAVIRKAELCSKYRSPFNPYYLAIKFGLERLHWFVRQQTKEPTTIVFERRGKLEDADLLGQFTRVVNGDNHERRQLPFNADFAVKDDNLEGQQIADLVARPLGRFVMDPSQPNRTIPILKQKIVSNAWGRREGFGLKIFP